MSKLDHLRKHELECLRLSAECMQLAGYAATSALQSHFLRMASVWPILADRSPGADTQAES